jgi:hypothetical protein
MSSFTFADKMRILNKSCTGESYPAMTAQDKINILHSLAPTTPGLPNTVIPEDFDKGDDYSEDSNISMSDGEAMEDALLFDQECPQDLSADAESDCSSEGSCDHGCAHDPPKPSEYILSDDHAYKTMQRKGLTGNSFYNSYHYINIIIVIINVVVNGCYVTDEMLARRAVTEVDLQRLTLCKCGKSCKLKCSETAHSINALVLLRKRIWLDAVSLKARTRGGRMQAIEHEMRLARQDFIDSNDNEEDSMNRFHFKIGDKKVCDLYYQQFTGIIAPGNKAWKGWNAMKLKILGPTTHSGNSFNKYYIIFTYYNT